MSEYISIVALYVSSIFLICLVLSNSKPDYSNTLWEKIPTPKVSAEMMRTPVPHGWLVSYSRLARSMVYVPDEKHEWRVKG